MSESEPEKDKRTAPERKASDLDRVVDIPIEEVPSPNKTIELNLEPSDLVSGKSRDRSADGAEEHLEELAEDMLDVFRRLQILEELQRDALRQLEDLGHRITETETTTNRVLGALKRDLLGERKSLANRHAFDVVAPTLESMRRLRDGLDEERDDRMRSQLTGVIGTLRNLLQGLGIEEFRVEVGETFDPLRMECVGYLEGEPGVVVEMVQAGYRAGPAVIKPVGVRIAAPGNATRTSDASEEGAET